VSVVGLWGAYFFGNFGDDLMAVQLAKEIRRAGHTPLAYGLDSGIAASHDIKRAESLASLFRESALVVIGGGGLLTKVPVARRVLRREPWVMERELRRFVRQARRTPETPVIAISVGGDGEPTVSLGGWRRRLWSEVGMESLTVRLRTDCAILDGFGKKATYYPDTVLSGFGDLDGAPPDAWRCIRSRAAGELVVGLNLKRSSGGRLLAAMSQLRQRALRAGLKLRLLLLTSHIPGYVRGYELESAGVDETIETIRYREPLAFLSEIAKIDLVISSKLHVGVAALACGVPFVSYGGPRKASAFLGDLNLDGWCFGERDVFGVVELIRSIAEGAARDEIWRAAEAVEKARAQSLGHRDTLWKHIRGIAG
jgi:hypothetical protein